MSVSMAQMLESVTDAISAMVIFAAEAANNTAVLRNLASGAQGVATAVNYLVAQANSTVGLWEKLGSAEMAKRMKENNDELTAAVNGIVNACKAIAENPKASEPKAAILDEGKAVMKLMVGLIQYNDMYEVMVALKQIHVAKSLLDQIFNDVFPADDFMVLIQSVQQIIDRRLLNCHESRAKQWLKECKEELGELTMPLVTLVKRSWTDESFVSKIPIVLEPFNDSITKCIKALKLSAKSPFDLSLLDNSAEFNARDDELDDIVVTAGDFANALAAVRKAIQDGDEFEIERAIRAMEKDILAQLAAAEDLANQMTDPVAKAELLAKIRAARQQLADILAQLAKEIPLALMSGDFSKVNKLIADLEKLFNSVSEELALHEIQKAAISIDKLLDELPPAVDEKDVAESRALNKDVQKEIARQAAMAKMLADGFDDEYRKQRVLNNVADLAALTVELSKTTEEALKDDRKARAHLDEVIADIRKHNRDLVKAATLSTPQELLEVGAMIENQMRGMKDFAMKGLDNAGAKKLQEMLDNLQGKVVAQAALAKNYGENISDDPEKKSALIAAAGQLGKEAHRFGTNAKSLIGAPKSKENLDNFLEGADKTSKANRDIVSLAFDSPDDELELLQGKVASDLARLKEAVKAKNVKIAAEAIADTKKDTNEFRLLADIMGAEIEEQAIKDTLLATENHLAAQVAELTPETRDAIKDYKISFPKLNETTKTILDDIGKIVAIAGAGSPEDQMIKNADNMTKVAKRIGHEAEKGDLAKVGQKNKDEAKKVQKQQRLAKQVANRCEEVLPESAKTIQLETSKLEGLRKQLEDTANKVAKAPTDKDAIKGMKKAQNDFKEQAELTAKLAKDIKSGKSEAEERAKEAARIAEEKRRREEEERERERQRRLAEANIPKGPVITEIVEAVVAMQEITDKYTIDKSAAGSLLELANRLAIAFQQLASLGKTGTKKELIMKAREIADIIKDIMKYIEEAANKCRDPILNNEMKDYGHNTLNFGTQLKIICGVKANLILEHDPDAAGALVSCSRELCKAVGEIVKLSQIAKLKPKQ